MIRAKIDTNDVQTMEEGVLHKWLESKGFNTSNRIKRTDLDVGSGDVPGIPSGKVTLFEQFPAPRFKIRPNLSEFIDTKAENRNKRRWEKEGQI